MADDDIDALLDGCLDDLNEQTERQKAEDEQRAQQLLLDESAAAAGPSDMDPQLRQFQSMLMQLTSVMQNPDNPEAMQTLQRTLATTIQSLEADEHATPEERAELERCAAAVKNLDNRTAEGEPDKELSPEEADRMRKLVENMLSGMNEMAAAGDAAPAAAAASAAASAAPSNPEEMLRQMMEAMQAAQPTAASTSATADDAAAPGGGDVNEADALAALMSVLNTDELVQPFLRMASKYPAFLETAATRLPAEEYERYQKQYRAVLEVTAFFPNGRLFDDNDDSDADVKSAKLAGFSAAVERLQQLGAPPPELQTGHQEE